MDEGRGTPTNIAQVSSIVAGRRGISQCKYPITRMKLLIKKLPMTNGTRFAGPSPPATLLRNAP